MAVTLLLRTHHPTSSGREEEGVTFEQPRVVLGRGEACDLRIPERSVSHRHCSLRQRGTDYVVVDEGSTNGTFHGMTKLHAQSPKVLRSGDLIRLGRVWLEVRLEHGLPTQQPALATKDLALAMVAEALDQAGESIGPRLVVIEGPDAGKEIALPLSGQAVVIGRGRDVDLPIDVTDASRRHARVMRNGDHLLVRDLGSRNGTVVQGELIPADRDTILRPEESFEIGPDCFAFTYPAVEALHDIERAEDEHIDPKELISPPPRSLPEVGEPTQHDEPDASAVDAEASPEPAPARVPPRRRPPQARKDTGWGKTDIGIVLLALAVLAISAIGLFWLFRGE